MNQASRPSSRVDMSQILNNPQYQGKHVVIVGDKIFTAKTGKKAAQILAKVHREFPNQVPKITYVPEADTLIL
jgi:predicted HAD superfamily phosphohydrolase YqeG